MPPVGTTRYFKTKSTEGWDVWRVTYTSAGTRTELVNKAPSQQKAGIQVHAENVVAEAGEAK